MNRRYKLVIVLLLLLGICLVFSPDSPITVRTAYAPDEAATFGNVEPSAFNWTLFWERFNSHSAWDLEVDNGTGWKSVKSDLTIVKNYTASPINEERNNTCKIGLIFDASETGDYRLSFVIDARVRSHIYNASRNRYTLNYTINGDDYLVYFDWSDIASIPNLQFSHGVTEIAGIEVFWFRIRRDNVPQGAHLELDPTFGNEDIGSGHSMITDFIQAGKYEAPSSGTAQSISIYIDDIQVDDKYKFAVKGALYNANYDELIAETQEIFVEWGVDNFPLWVTCPFSDPKPTITGGVYYVIVGTANGTQYNNLDQTFVSSSPTYWHQSYEYDNGLPASLSEPTSSAKKPIYCTYTVNLPTIGEFESSASTVIADEYFLLNATLDDPDGASTLVNATISINGSIALEWDNDTNTFSETSDPSGYCTLDASGSTQATLNSTAYRLSWRIKLAWTYSAGGIHVTSASVYDEDSNSGSGSMADVFTFDVSSFALGKFSSNASEDSYSYNSTTKHLTIVYIDTPGSYVLKLYDVGSAPTFVLNCSYDEDNYVADVMEITHSGNYTLTISYESWATTRIYRADHRITSVSWGNDLSITLSGSLGASGTLEIYCGSRGIPSQSSGFSNTSYSALTTIFSGTYTFSSTFTGTISWETDSGSSGGNGGITVIGVAVNAQSISLGAVARGSIVMEDMNVSWWGVGYIILQDVSFTGEGSEWCSFSGEVPKTLRRHPSETKGSATIPIQLKIPAEAGMEEYKVVVRVKMGVTEYQSQMTTADLTFTVSSTPLTPTGLPSIVSGLLFLALIGVVGFSLKSKVKS
jgi:hypothetical protein